VNMLLGLVTLWLVARLTALIGGNAWAQALAMLIYALWIPAAYATGIVAKENLTTPLLLIAITAVITMARGARPTLSALSGGLAFGFGLIAGGSSALIGLLFPVALLRAWGQAGFRRAVHMGALAALGLAVMIGPWLAYTDRMVGAPVLNSNSGFNLYLGNNPAATGGFVGIENTPMRDTWPSLLASEGEVGAANALAVEAQDWAVANPADAATLAAVKLARFGAPNLPDAGDRQANAAIAALRWVDVVQYLLIALLALAAVITLRTRHPAINWIAAAIALFWLVHAAAYVMPRYREPVMPLVIVLAALFIAARLPVTDDQKDADRG
jgi:hypothetical protein